MLENNIINSFNEFLTYYDASSKDELWKNQSIIFHNYWTSKILNNSDELNDFETDEIVKILDRNGKGNTHSSDAIAKAMIPQGAWRRMFNEIKSEARLKELLNNIFSENDNSKKIEYVNQLYKYNEKNRNSLTGNSGTAINCMVAAWDPFKNISAVSLKHRKKIFEFLQLSGLDFDEDTQGKKIVVSNELILGFFENKGITASARTISAFLYSDPIKKLWEIDTGDEIVPYTEEIPISETEGTTNPSIFYMESQLEDFIIENWDNTELGKSYDLIEEEGEIVSQQYRTPIGIIDILVKEKKTDRYVVIELKRDQTSDSTVGQLARYMGWIEENKGKGLPPKGIIITAKYDEKLFYALKKIKDTEIYLYEVKFKLNEFKKS